MSEVRLAVYPVTYEQEAMWLHEQLDASPSRYLESWVYRLTGPLDESAVEWALGELVRRHEALRTVLAMDDGRLVQIVRPFEGMTLLRRGVGEAGLDADLRRTVTEPLDPERSPVRASLLRESATSCVLAVEIHHSAIDDWSLAILDAEFGELYRARLAGRPARLEPLPIQMGEYAAAQRAAGVDESVLDYWCKQLNDMPAETVVPADRPRPDVLGHAGGQVRFPVSPALASGVRLMARRLRATPFVVVAAALTALLHAYTGADDLILGAPISPRGAAELDPLIGCLTSLMPLRHRGVRGRSFAELVALTRAALLDVMAHGNVPYSHLIRATVTSEHRGRVPLCQTLVQLDDAPRVPLDLPAVTAERIYVHSGTVKAELGLTLVACGRAYQGYLEYASDLYDAATGDRVARDFCAVLATVIDNPERSLAGLLA